MNIRDAILKAADHIEQNPLKFDFWASDIPTGCGTPGCALGWIAHFSGAQTTCAHDSRWAAPVHVFCEDFLGLHPEEFYEKIEDLSSEWRSDASACATGLRAYADKYHPAESRALIPASVLAIFTMSPQELAREFERA